MMQWNGSFVLGNCDATSKRCLRMWGNSYHHTQQSNKISFIGFEEYSYLTINKFNKHRLKPASGGIVMEGMMR